jgi:hypothetical protein
MEMTGRVAMEFEITPAPYQLNHPQNREATGPGEFGKACYCVAVALVSTHPIGD